jgi:hypothetical protein
MSPRHAASRTAGHAAKNTVVAQPRVVTRGRPLSQSDQAPTLLREHRSGPVDLSRVDAEKRHTELDPQATEDHSPGRDSETTPP